MSRMKLKAENKQDKNADQNSAADDQNQTAYD